MSDVNNAANAVTVKFKKLHILAETPKYALEGDAGMDLTAISVQGAKDTVTYGTGLAFEIPSGYLGLLFPRSSVRNKDLVLSNCVGVVDPKYRGEVMATFNKTAKDAKCYRPGERVVQLIVLPFPTVTMEEVASLSDTERGEGGFGSTGL